MGGRVRTQRFDDPEPSRLLGLAWRATSPRKPDFIDLGVQITKAIRSSQKAATKGIMK
jgi:LysR family hydrogen peroxide-inducible transcriptional activator